MDAVLEQAIELGLLIRDAPEGRRWRKSREELDRIPLNREDLSEVLPEGSSLVGYLGLVHQANKVRPLLLPLLVGKYAPHLAYTDVKSELRAHPQVWRPYRELERCTAFIGIVVTFLRTIAPGYPHGLLIYTLTETVWSQVNALTDLPWDLATSILPENASDARLLGLGRVVPASAPAIEVRLNMLADAIKQSEAWSRLHYAYREVQRRKNLRRELLRARDQFAREFPQLGDARAAGPDWYSRFEQLTREIYAKRGKRIQEYANSFLDYEWLIERIYWLLTQLVAHEHISCVSSRVPQQLQQLSLSYGSRAYMTALAQTRGRTLAVGQLIHASLPETDDTASGLYQVEQLHSRYDPGSGFQALFRARCLWYCGVRSLVQATGAAGTLLHEGVHDMVRGTKIKILDPDGDKVIATLRPGQFVEFKISDTMYLP